MGKRGGGADATTAAQEDASNWRRLSRLLGDEGPALATRLEASGLVASPVVTALCELAEQAVRSGIDYRTLGLGWNHPTARTEYRLGRHRSITDQRSRKRAAESQRQLVDALQRVVDGEVDDPEALVVEAFRREIGLPVDAPRESAECGITWCPPPAGAGSATFAGVASALRGELLLPLRALNEASFTRTMMGEPLPEEEMSQVVLNLTEAVLSGEDGYTAWRYGNRVGREQLRGLSDEQLAIWREATEMEHTRRLVTHEGGADELAFFWATKIGGPSHGFDIEGQCILPLLANARHKVILVNDPAWPHHPAGRAHWRLLWATGGRAQQSLEARLWLETVNCDFAAGSAGLSTDLWEKAVLRHAVAKADAMRVPLSVEDFMADELARAVTNAGGSRKQVQRRSERMLLRPSNAVIEASDYLSGLHDWVQQEEEITEPISRVVYTPAPRSD